MRYLLICIAVICAGTLCAQCPPPQQIRSNYQFQAEGADSATRLPVVRPTGCYMKIGDLYYNTADKKIHWMFSNTQDTTIIGPLGIDGTLRVGDSTSFLVQFDSVDWVDDTSGNFLNWSPSNYDSSYPAFGGFPASKQKGWMMGVSKFQGVNADGRPNVVYSLGYNVNPNGSQRDTSDAAWRFGYESHYDLFFGEPAFEFHQPEITLKNGLQFRPNSWYIGKITGYTQYDGMANGWNWFTDRNDSAGMILDNGGFKLEYDADHSGNNQFQVQNLRNNNAWSIGLNEFGTELSFTSGTTNGNARWQFDQPIRITNNGLFNGGLGGVYMQTSLNAEYGVNIDGSSGVGLFRARDVTMNMTAGGTLYDRLLNQGTSGDVRVDRISTGGSIIYYYGGSLNNWNVNYLMSTTGQVNEFYGSKPITGKDTSGRVIVGDVIPSIDPSAQFEVALTSANSIKGSIPMPKVTEAQQDGILSPADGLQVFNTDRDRPSYYSSQNGQWIGAGEIPHTIFTPTTGGTVALVRGQINIINPAGTLATLTLQYPTGLTPNDFIEIKFTQPITSITSIGATVIDGLSSATAGLYTKYAWDSSSWY